MTQLTMFHNISQYKIIGLTLLLLGQFALTTVVSANDLQIRILPEYHSGNTASLFTLNGGTSQYKNRAEVEWKKQKGNFVLNTALISEKSEGEPSNTDIQINEAFYETEWNDWDISLGQKRLDWGIAWGYRPLDTLQQSPRQTLHPVMLQGLPHISFEKFKEDSNVSLIISADVDWQGVKIKDADSLATIRWFKLKDDWELLGLAAVGEDSQKQLGTGFSRVIGDSWKVYGELLHERNYSRWKNTLLDTGELISSSNPVKQVTEKDATQGVLGFTWTGDNGVSFLTEYAYDGRAYKDKDWQALRDLAQRQHTFFRQNPSVVSDRVADSMLRANQQAYLVPNLLQDNVIMRLSHKGSTYNTQLETVYTPEDKGGAATFKIDRNIAKKHSLQLGARHYFGGSNSAFGNLNEEQMLFATWQSRW